MRSIACALLLVFATASVRAGDVVDASKDAKTKRRKSTSRVITNADVKKSKGKITENKIPLTPIDTTPKESETEQHEIARLARIAREEKLAALDQEIATLSAQLLSLERMYFEENNLDVRDGAIARKFRDVQEKLEAKRKERAALAPPTTPE